MTSNLVYSTDGTSTTDLREEEVFLPEPEDFVSDPFCFVCGRCTDHWGEHDDLVEAGMADYKLDGSVVKTEKWSAAAAKQITDATWAELKAAMERDEERDE